MNTSKIVHRNENRIKVDFPYNQQITFALKQINNARWSKTHRAWHIPDNIQAWEKLKSLFPEMNFEEIKQIPPSLPQNKITVEVEKITVEVEKKVTPQSFTEKDKTKI